ncbi:MAG: hypothetical protein AB1705_15525 [Verrucomicrobiota bacterium]
MIKRLPFPWWLAAGPIVAAVDAAAHPGHGLLNEGVSHVLTSPDHLLLVALGGAAVAALASAARHTRTRALARCAGSAIAAIAMALWIIG